MDVTPLAADSATEAIDGVHLAQLAAGERASLQHFRIEAGAVVDTHEHHHEQIGWLAAGELIFTVDGEEVVVGPDESYVIPGGEPHAAENRGDVDAVGVEVFAPPRAKPPWEE